MSTELASWVSHFQESRQSVESAPMLAKRRRAFSAFQALGFPSQRSEEFRYTNVEGIVHGGFSLRGAPGAIDALPTPLSVEGDHLTAVFVDGRFNAALSDLERHASELTITSVGTMLREQPDTVEAQWGQVAGFDHHGFLALNAAMADDGIWITVPDHVTAAQTLRIIHIATDASAASAGHTRHFVSLGRNSVLRMIEEYVAFTEAGYFNNVVMEVALDAGARLERLERVDESPSAFHIEATLAHLARDSFFLDFGLSQSAKLLRRETRVQLKGQGSAADLAGVYLPGGDSVFDQLTMIDHASPDATSSQNYRGVAAGRGRGVFNGKILVRRDAQRTRAYQQNRNILLSPDATADTRPQLEIYADDVKCSHGATVGELDRDALFYLRSRGLDTPLARRIMLEAFASEAFSAIPETVWRSLLMHRLSGSLENFQL